MGMFEKPNKNPYTELPTEFFAFLTGEVYRQLDENIREVQHDLDKRQDYQDAQDAVAFVFPLYQGTYDERDSRKAAKLYKFLKSTDQDRLAEEYLETFLEKKRAYEKLSNDRSSEPEDNHPSPAPEKKTEFAKPGHETPGSLRLIANNLRKNLARPNLPAKNREVYEAIVKGIDLLNTNPTEFNPYFDRIAENAEGNLKQFFSRNPKWTETYAEAYRAWKEKIRT